MSNKEVLAAILCILEAKGELGYREPDNPNISALLQLEDALDLLFKQWDQPIRRNLYMLDIDVTGWTFNRRPFTADSLIDKYEADHPGVELKRLRSA